eukprot:TRINITY_DN57005_c0_g1_i1.p1 TRINITY_DN57005_c0_g1~~TRINITY_DN57005_c0_g1_i1.p1  ORF type:complete len:718 (-),score=88.40 TRINITY_DN57005_c0_g1_i1:9-2162(-)
MALSPPAQTRRVITQWERPKSSQSCASAGSESSLSDAPCRGAIESILARSCSGRASNPKVKEAVSHALIKFRGRLLRGVVETVLEESAECIYDACEEMLKLMDADSQDVNGGDVKPRSGWSENRSETLQNFPRVLANGRSQTNVWTKTGDLPMSIRESADAEIDFISAPAETCPRLFRRPSEGSEISLPHDFLDPLPLSAPGQVDESPASSGLPARELRGSGGLKKKCVTVGEDSWGLKGGMSKRFRRGKSTHTTLSDFVEPAEKQEREEKRETRRSSIGYGRTTSLGKVAMFPDKKVMAEAVVDGVKEGEFNVHSQYKEHGLAQQIAKSNLFESLTLFVISVNALWIAIDADYNTAAVLVKAQGLFQGMENLFCIFFTVEISIRYAAFKRSVDAFTNAWFVFDFTLVLFLVFDTWIMSLIYLVLFSSSGQNAFVGDTTLFRLLRLLRLSRTLRMVKLMRAMPELLILIKGMMAASRSVFFTLCLLVLIIYIFAIAFRLLTDGLPLGDAYFSSVPTAMGSLLLLGTIPDMEQIVRDCSTADIFMGALILLFILVASLTVMNMLIGVLCEVVSVVASVERDQMDADFVKSSLLAVLQKSDIDADGNKMLDKQEFQALCLHPDACRVMNEVGVDVISLVDFVDFIYEETATDNEMSFADLFKLILQLRGSNNATVRDVVELRRFVFQSFKIIQDKLDVLLEHDDIAAPRHSVPSRGSVS